ncbi:YfiR family protein [Beggiatoa leptomitoformis]|uniref:YfiR family protein n=1 Tax=Beggiatoa leptomitoformis TaxID=288004 RepID=UPI000705D530|nr:YfiR family protein [Beggiatoa leptomitoformis]
MLHKHYFSILLLCLSYTNMLYAGDLSLSESQLKAMYLFRYSSFIEWTTEALTTNTFKICVFGENPFGKSLDLAVANETVNGLPIEALYINQQKNILGCHILFIAKSESAELDSILTLIQHSPILTVSDIKDFIHLGGMIEFYIRDNKVRFFINPDLSKGVGLRIDANLLRVGDIVTP